MQPEEKPEGSHFHRVGGCGGRGSNCRQGLESRTDQEIGVLGFGRFAAVDLIKNEHGDLLAPDEPLDVVQTLHRNPPTVGGIAGADLFVVHGVASNAEVLRSPNP